MAIDPSLVSDLNPTGPLPTLADRVKARVARAERLLDHRAREANAKHKHIRPTRLTKAAAPLTDDSMAQRETQSLQRVYSEMRTIYRGYRRETGAPAVPELRTAARAFKRGQSLSSLVEVATFLDDRKLLTW
jgi:hypothetical protein